jgi:transaldolase/glucose-6-phosphate isomerase
VVRITLSDPMQLGQEFFRWEMATAVAGAMLSINPFDQPDVEAAKVKTRDLTEAYERSKALPEQHDT